VAGHAFGDSIRVLFRPKIKNEPLDIPVERFLASLRLQQRGKLDDLGFEIDKNALKSGD